MSERDKRWLGKNIFAHIRLFQGLLINLVLLSAYPLSAQTSYSGMESWYHPFSLALAGGGSIFSGPDSDRLNPAVLTHESREFHMSLIRYPAEIASESLSLGLPGKEAYYVIGLRHMGYGVFEGFDEQGLPQEDYSSGDNWITFSLARPIKGSPLVWGLTTGLFISNLASYQSLVLTLTSGVMIPLEKYQTRMGLSIRNAGWVLRHYTGAKESLPTTIVGSLAKQLAYLPLELSLDAGYHMSTGKIEFYLGGVFQLPYHFQLAWGTSADKFDQQTGNNVYTDFMASTGLGLAYDYGEYRIELGSYFYGTGGWNHGFGFGARF